MSIPGLLTSSTKIPSKNHQNARRAKNHIKKMGISIPDRKRIIVAITGATGAEIGIQLLQTLRRLNVETHVIISKWAGETIKWETNYTTATVRALADHAYR